MHPELAIELNKTRDRFFAKYIRKDDSEIPDRPMPPVPKYEKRKIKFTPLLVYTFAKNFVWSLRP